MDPKVRLHLIDGLSKMAGLIGFIDGVLTIADKETDLPRLELAEDWINKTIELCQEGLDKEAEGA